MKLNEIKDPDWIADHMEILGRDVEEWLSEEELDPDILRFYSDYLSFLASFIENPEGFLKQREEMIEKGLI